ncbi:hypothetical protein MCHI_003030 [Candidatus Magnetoovum chiemensis]|nr:hypothetical protein MCHI_003030 [Candidatus Magnetoovum chiemensis]
MTERKVSEIEVETIISNPDYQEYELKDRMNSFKYINGRYVRVTHKEDLIVSVTVRKKPFNKER